MACNNCGHSMHNLGLESERTFWCPRCGAIKNIAGDFENVSTPMLVDKVKRAELGAIEIQFGARTLRFALTPEDWRDVLEAAGLKPKDQ